MHQFLLAFATGRIYLNQMVSEERIEAYIPALRRLAVSYAESYQESEDLFQEIAVAVWKALSKFRGESSERTFVYRVAHNTAIRYVSSKQRRSGREHSTLESDAEFATSDNPELAAIRNQQWKALWNALRELPVIDRQVMLLRLEGLSAAEVSQVTGFTEGAVAMRFSRLRRQLSDKLSGTRKAKQ